MMKTNFTKYTLKKLETDLSECISDYEYWGDLNISYDEFNYIGELFRKEVWSYAGPVDLNLICKKYPCSLTTFCVFLIRYKYNINFWGLLSDELNIEINAEWQGIIGSNIRSTFKKYKFDYSEVKNDPKVNIAPIIYEACLPPDSSLDDLFYILNYDSYSVFDPEVLIDEMIDMRSYLIRKPLLQFLKRFKNDKAIDFLLEVHDTILAVNHNTLIDSRYRNRYVEWTEKEKERNTINKRKEIDRQTRPYLFFDNGKKGLCITLPRIVIHNDWAEEVVWNVKSNNGFEKKIICRVFSDDNVRFVESINVAVSPSDKYTITMDDEETFDEDDLLTWEIKGIDNKKPSIFNSYGRLINAGYIQRPNMILIYNDKTDVKYSDNLYIETQSYPTDVQGYKVDNVIPTGGEAEIVITGIEANTILRSRPHLNLALNGRKLFMLSKDCFDIQLFTEIPSLVVRYEDGDCLKDIEIRIDGKETITSEIKGDTDFEINLNDTIKRSSKSYGIHNVRVYQYDRFIKQIEFAYVPKIKTNYNPVLRWPNIDDRKYKKSNYFSMPENWDIDFSDCNTSRDNEKTVIEYFSNTGVLHGTLRYINDDTNMNFKFVLPVNPFEISVISNENNDDENITDRVFKTDLTDFEEKELWIEISLFEDYVDDSYSLKLISVNGVEQEERLKITSGGTVNKNLSLFKDTINGCPLPAQIVFSSKDNDDLPLVYIKEHLQLSKCPDYAPGKDNDYISLSVNEGEKDIEITKFGIDYQTWKIGFNESKLSKSKLNRGYKFCGKLEEGVYIINTSSTDDIFEDMEIEAELTMNNNIMYVPHNKEKEFDIITSSQWLDASMSYICKNRISGEPYVNELIAANKIKKSV